VHTLPNDYVLTTLGGSSSCYKHGYGEYIRNRSAGNVTWWNPSQGSSGSDWAALYLDSLVPQNTSVVLWEFAINDWWALPAGISEANFQQQVLELFLRRLVHRIPKVTVGIVVLWQPYALKCWPECPRDDIKWNLSLPVLEHYSESIASFAVDANAIGKRQFTNRTQLLADLHHPTDAGHAMIAEAVLLHLRSLAAAKPSSQDGPPPSLPQACCLAAIDEASGSAFAGHRLLGATSLAYTTPTLQDFDTRWVPAITTRSEATVESFGSNSSERSGTASSWHTSRRAPGARTRRAMDLYTRCRLSSASSASMPCNGRRVGHALRVCCACSLTARRLTDSTCPQCCSSRAACRLNAGVRDHNLGSAPLRTTTGGIDGRR